MGLLLRVYNQETIRKYIRQCDASAAEEMTLKAPREITSSYLQDPSDPDTWYGAHKDYEYQVQVMEIYSTSPEETIKVATLRNLSPGTLVQRHCQSGD